MVAILDGHLCKIEIAFLEDCLDTTWYPIHSDGLEYCHKLERTPFADLSD